jgi:exodeoxyribonuclease V gamma subunit
MFTFIHGNRQELLARHLAVQIGIQPLNIFEREVVVVQSGGMARWLQMFLAEELGIATQLRFTFPAAYLWELFARVLPDVPRATPFASDILIWQLLRLMPTAPQTEAFAPLYRYLADDDTVKRHGLARKLAQCFDSYLAYRPEWVGAWLGGKQIGLGEHEAWQAWLWQQIGKEAGELPEAHPAALFFRALAAEAAESSFSPSEQDRSTPQATAGLGTRGELSARLPRRITVFGMGAMPPPYLDIFKRLGQYIDVSFYLVNPCREYWGDLVTDRALARAALETPEALPLLETGHPLLGSLGQVTRHCFDFLAGDHDIDLFVEPGEASLLQALQGDMLDMRRRAPDERLPLDGDDDSIQFHVCHGATREIEVLHDRLLALFAADPTLQPHHVLVLTPDIVSLAPLVEAVFSAPGGRHAIPYTIADRPLELEAPLLRAFNALLDLAHGRFDAESVLGVLEQPCVAERFRFDEEALELVRAWVGESGIRWGLSGAARAARGLPGDDTHSWHFGLKRMLLGVALPQQLMAGGTDTGARLFEGTLPFDAAEGVRTQVLGKLLGFIDALEAALQQLARERSVADWAELLPLICERFCYDEERLPFADTSAQRAVNTLRTTLQQLAKSAQQARCDEAVPLDVMRRELKARLDDMPPGWAFLGGGVTFAQLLAYRGMPARVVCLIGMNDGVFPRNPAVPGFDLLHKHRQAGDRELRAEDRHAFLEALLSARQYLHVSYSGRGIRDNAELPPSMLVAELRDALDMTAAPADGGSASAALTVQHRLQAFSPRYFDGSDPRLYSHAAHYAHAATAARASEAAGRAAAQPFLARALPEAPPELLTITPQQFLAFFRNPAQHLLRNRLGIHLEESEGLLDTVEPFVPDGLSRYWLRTQLVEDWQAGIRSARDAHALAHARGLLPHGAAGDVWFAELWNQFAPFAEQISASAGAVLPPCRIRLDVNGVTVLGSIGGLQQAGNADPGGTLHLEWRVGDIRPVDRLSLWLQHVLLHAAGLRCSSVLMTPKENWTLAPFAGADVERVSGAHLETLCAIYKRGSSELLPFFPATSLHWLTAQREGKDGFWKRDWEPSAFNKRAECLDAYVDLAWRACDPFDQAFEILAGQIYGPMLEHAADAAEAEGAE